MESHEVLRSIVHYGLHLVFPMLLSFVFFRKTFWKSYLLMLATMCIDLDHFLANPIFDPHRCSIGFHPLHTIYAVPFYSVLIFFSKTRALGIGFILHLLTDLLDCWMIK